MNENLRKFDRLDVRLAALVKPVEVGATSVKATIVNLGPEGAFCQAESLIPQGTHVIVSFGIADMNISVNADGIVRWVSQAKGREGIGVHFTQITKEEKDAVYRYILIKHAESRGLI